MRKKKKVLTQLMMIAMAVFLLSGCTNSEIEALCDAIESGDTEKAMELAENIEDYDRYVMDSMLIDPVSILSQGGGTDTRTPLIVAAKEGNYEMMEYLLENGADPNFGKKAATYPLGSYCDYAAGAKEDGVRLLLSYGADPNLTESAYPINYLIRKMFTLKKNDEGIMTEIVDEEKKKRYDMIKQQVVQLIEAGSVVLEESGRVQGRYYSNILEYLVRMNEVEIVEALLLDGKLLECINVQNEEGYTPLMFAAENGLTKMCQLLLDYDADTTYTNKNHLTACDLATENGYEDIARLFP